MSYITAVQEVAYLVGVAPPTAIGDPAPVAQRFKRFADRAGQEIGRRADWTRMMRSATFTGDGATNTWPLPDGFDRLQQGNPVYVVGGDFLRGATSPDEWILVQKLPQAVGGPPRVFTMQAAGAGQVASFKVYPTPGPAVAISFNYMAQRFIVGSTTEHFTLDADETYFPERLLILNMVWRWRRAQGAPYDDELKEFEAELMSAASADAGLRPPQAA